MVCSKLKQTYSLQFISLCSTSTISKVPGPSPQSPTRYIQVTVPLGKDVAIFQMTTLSGDWVRSTALFVKGEALW